jgi:hypothetical protein
VWTCSFHGFSAPCGWHRLGSLNHAEVVKLYELISRCEWAEDLEMVEIRDRAETIALSRIELTLQPLVIEAGTKGCAAAVRDAWAQVRDSNAP